MKLTSPFSPSVPQYVTAAVSTAGAIGGAYLAYRYLQQLKASQNKIPEEWQHAGYVKRMYLYPIKSCAGVELTEAQPTTLGFKDGYMRDRVLMVVNASDNNFITARAYPELYKVQPSYNTTVLTLSHPDMEPIHINLEEVMMTQKTIKATVWQSPVSVFDCGEEADKWINKILNRPDESFRLVYYASHKPRPLVGNPKIFTKVRHEDAGIFPDYTSYNFINEASVEDLNTRLKDKVTERFFRPNLLLSGPTAFDEDNWKFLKIGENVFEVVKPCPRCLITTMDPETGVRNKDTEPLETLRSYRLHKDPEIRKTTGKAPIMGIQLALRTGGGPISVNEPFYVAY